MLAIASTPGALRLLAVSVVARLPLAMLGIGLLVHAQRLTGSFAAAGVVTGAHALALGAGGPWLGRLVDRRGQTPVLVASGCATAALLGGVAVLPAGVPLPVLVALATAIGLSLPPLGACVRALLPELAADAAATRAASAHATDAGAARAASAAPTDAGAVQGAPVPAAYAADLARAAYAADAAVVELTWIVGPPLALGLGALWSTGAALVAAGGVLLAGSLAFAAHPASRAWRPAPAAARPRGGSLGTPAMRTLVIVLIAAGVLFGAVEVAVAAAADVLGSTAAAGPLLGLWGAGSLVGGAVAVRLGGGAHTAAGLSAVLGALAAGHLALVAATGSVYALAAVLLVAGAAIAPTYASVYAMVDRAAPVGTVTEAFAWLSTAVAIGASAGAAAAGALADHGGPAAAFALAGAAGAVAALATTLRAPTLAVCAVPVAA